MINSNHNEDNFEEAARLLDHYALARWIAPCPKCGEWLTSLGLCPECGIRYELVEQTKVIDRDSFCYIQKHVYIEGVCAKCGRKDGVEW